MSANLIEITSEQHLADVLSANANVVVDFWAPWCGPCRQLSPVLELVAKENSNVVICKVNVDEQSALSVKNEISSIPALHFYKNNVKVYNTKGFLGKKELLAAISTNLSV